MFLSFYQKMQVPNLFGWVSFSMLLLCCCICLYCIGIGAGLGLVWYMFYRLIIFLGVNQYSYFDVLVFSPKHTGREFYRLHEFYAAADPVLQLIKLYVCTMLVLIHVMCHCCSFFGFLGHACQHMMSREISRPCTHPNQTHIRPPVCSHV